MEAGGLAGKPLILDRESAGVTLAIAFQRVCVQQNINNGDSQRMRIKQKEQQSRVRMYGSRNRAAKGNDKSARIGEDANLRSPYSPTISDDRFQGPHKSAIAVDSDATRKTRNRQQLTQQRSQTSELSCRVGCSVARGRWQCNEARFSNMLLRTQCIQYHSVGVRIIVPRKIAWQKSSQLCSPIDCA